MFDVAMRVTVKDKSQILAKLAVGVFERSMTSTRFATPMTSEKQSIYNVPMPQFEPYLPHLFNVRFPRTSVSQRTTARPQRCVDPPASTTNVRRWDTGTGNEKTSVGSCVMLLLVRSFLGE